MALIEYLITGSFGGPYLFVVMAGIGFAAQLLDCGFVGVSSHQDPRLKRRLVSSETRPIARRGRRPQPCLLWSDTNSMSGGPNLFQGQPDGSVRSGQPARKRGGLQHRELSPQRSAAARSDKTRVPRASKQGEATTPALRCREQLQRDALTKRRPRQLAELLDGCGRGGAVGSVRRPRAAA